MAFLVLREMSFWVLWRGNVRLSRLVILRNVINASNCLFVANGPRFASTCCAKSLLFR